MYEHHEVALLRKTYVSFYHTLAYKDLHVLDIGYFLCKQPLGCNWRNQSRDMKTDNMFAKRVIN